MPTLSEKPVKSAASALTLRRPCAGRLRLAQRRSTPDPAHPVLAIGSPAPDFSLPGVDGKTHTLSEYAGAKVLAIVFDCNHCPQSHLYESRIHKLYDDYRDKGVALVAVSPDNPASVHYADLAYADANDSLIEMQDRATERHIGFPYLYDGDAQTLTGQTGSHRRAADFHLRSGPQAAIRGAHRR